MKGEEMEFNGWKEKDMSLYDERRRTGVYGMKGEELEFTGWKKKN